MLTTRGRVLYTYLINNASKEQLNGITLFLALITGIQFSNFEKAMNSTSIGELRTVFWSEVIDKELRDDVEAGVTFTLKLKDEIDEDMKILFRDILRDGQSFFQTIEDLNLSISDCIMVKKIL